MQSTTWVVTLLLQISLLEMDETSVVYLLMNVGCEDKIVTLSCESVEEL